MSEKITLYSSKQNTIEFRNSEEFQFFIKKLLQIKRNEAISLEDNGEFSFSSLSLNEHRKYDKYLFQYLNGITLQNNSLPPFEYASNSMLNYLRYNTNSNKYLCDLNTDKGGTIKNILQSNKSFIHYLTTYPLRNTFRGYILLENTLLPSEIAIPWHFAKNIFTGSAFQRYFKKIVHPKFSHEFAISRSANVSLLLKRDPVIHNGSIVNLTKMYLIEDETIDAILISPYVLKALNADFDGDALTIYIIYGLESKVELESAFYSPILFHKKLRYHFSQSHIFFIFKTLFVDNDDLSIVLDLDDIREWLIKKFTTSLIKNIQIFFNNNVRYVSFFLRCSCEMYKKFLDDKFEKFWNENILDRMYLKFGSEFLLFIHEKLKNMNSIILQQSAEILSLQNWLIVHSGAKGSVASLLMMRQKEEEGRNSNLLTICDPKIINGFKQYGKNFILMSKNVPRSSYYATNLKWVSQTCRVVENTLFMNDTILLREFDNTLEKIYLSLL